MRINFGSLVLKSQRARDILNYAKDWLQEGFLLKQTGYHPISTESDLVLLSHTLPAQRSFTFKSGMLNLEVTARLLFFVVAACSFSHVC